MSGRGAAVWLVATAHTASRWLQGCESRGVRGVALAWGQVVAPDDLEPLRHALARHPAAPLLLTSSAALSHLPPHLLRGRSAFCVGRRTATAAAARGLKIQGTGRAGSDVLAAMSARHRPPGVERPVLLFVGGDEVRQGTAADFRQAGWTVETVTSYTVERRREWEEEVLNAPLPAVVVAGSPRAAGELLPVLPRRKDLVMAQVAIVVPGAFTAVAAASLKGHSIHVASTPDLGHLLDAIEQALSACNGASDTSARRGGSHA